MKAIIMLVFISFSLVTFAQTLQTQNTSTDLWDVSKDVMYELGADPRLKPKVLFVTVDETLGSRVRIKFQYVEEMFGKRTCTYWYDTKIEKVRANSWLCGF